MAPSTADGELGGCVIQEEMRLYGSCVPFEYFTMCIYYLFKKNFNGRISHINSDFRCFLKKIESFDNARSQSVVVTIDRRS